MIAEQLTLGYDFITYMRLVFVSGFARTQKCKDATLLVSTNKLLSTALVGQLLGMH